jgi:alanine racemase
MMMMMMMIQGNLAHVECEDTSDNSNNRGNWNHFKIIQKIAEQQTWKSHKGTRENSHIVYCARTYFVK